MTDLRKIREFVDDSLAGVEHDPQTVGFVLITLNNYMLLNDFEGTPEQWRDRVHEARRVALEQTVQANGEEP